MCVHAGHSTAQGCKNYCATRVDFCGVPQWLEPCYDRSGGGLVIFVVVA